MGRDLEVLSYLVNSVSQATEKLEKAVAQNKIDDSTKIKQTILEMSKKISEELK